MTTATLCDKKHLVIVHLCPCQGTQMEEREGERQLCVSLAAAAVCNLL